MTIRLIMATAILMFTNVVYSNSELQEVRLTDHEPNLFGVTYDDDDKEPFLDFKVSLEYPLANNHLHQLVNTSWFPDSLKQICQNSVFTDCYPHFAFTGRFGQYVGTRDSSPVVAKRFNPKVFLRFRTIDDDYMDLEYAHESNGQRITSLESYNALADDLSNTDNGEREHANDYISRGWDYVGVTYKHATPINPDRSRKLTTYFSYRNYIGGFLQGDIEEYFDWEPERDITSRKEVSGLRAILKIKDNQTPFLYNINKIAFIYETGIRVPTKYNTFSMELTTNEIEVPLMLWIRSGYESDLAQYYKYVKSIGIAFELQTY